MVQQADGKATILVKRLHDRLQRAEEAQQLSELRLRSLVEQTTDAVFCYEYDPPIPTDLPIEEQVPLFYRGVLAECNDVAARSYGATRGAEVIGRELTDLFGTSPGSLDGFFRAFIQNGYRTVDLEGTEVLEDGSIRYFLNNGHGFIEDDMLLRVWGTFRDITERKRAEEALREENGRAQQYLDIAGVMIVALDTEGRVTLINQRGCEILGYHREEIIGQDWFASFLPAHAWPQTESTFQQIMSGELEPLEHYENPILTKSGEERVIAWHNSVLTDEVGNTTGTLSSGEDITERKLAEAELREGTRLNQILLDAFPCVALLLRPSTREIVASNRAAVEVGAVPGAQCFATWAQREDPCPWCLAPVAWATKEAQHLEVEALGIVWDAHWIPVSEDLYMHYAFDITEHKRAEGALERYAQRLTVLHDLDQAILAAGSPEQIAQAAVVRVRDLIPCQRASVIALDFDADGGVVLATSVDGQVAAGTEMCIPLAARWIDDLRQDKVHVVEDVLALSDPPPIVGALQALGLRSSIAVPLIAQGELVGSLNLAADRLGAFAPEQAEIVREVARPLALAIHQARLFERLRTAHERLQALSHRLVEVQEAERRHIARELHDEVGQILTGLNLLLSTSARAPADAVEARLGDARALVEELIDKVDELSLDLRPAMLDGLGLLPALLWHVARYTAQTGVRVRLEHAGLERRFPSQIETAGYRIVQEALTNVARHADVGEVTVRLWADGDILSLQVEDRGAGFDSDTALAAGDTSGLGGMYERVALLDGQMMIESGPGTGTRLMAELPLGGCGQEEGA